MSEMIGHEEIEEKVLNIRGEKVLLEKDAAALYGVTAKEVVQAVKNNPDRFPEGYIITLTPEEWHSSKGSLRGRHPKNPPKVFTERGIYMLATVLKSPAAAQTSVDIVEIFAKIRRLTKSISELVKLRKKEGE